jgi:protease IV
MNKFLKSFLLIFAGIIIGFFLLIGIFVGIVVSFSDGNSATVKDKSWLVLDFAGEIKEKPVSEFPDIFTGGQKNIELIKYINAIQYAAIDNRILGIIINGDYTFYNREHSDEILSALTDFKKSGKKVVAWFSNGDNKNYNICLSADKIYMPKTNSSNLTLQGYSASLPYLKEVLDKVGVNFQVIHIGDFKGTGENYTQKNMSNELKESYTNVFNNFYDQELTLISSKRKIDKNKLQNLLSSGESIMMTSDKAKKLGFIDGQLRYEELLDNLSIKNKVSIYGYSTLLQKKISDTKIGVVYVEGSINNYKSSENGFSGDIVGAKSFIADIEKIKYDSSIKAVVIRVNSPGGSALASELMLQSLFDLRKIKPVYVSMGPVAASGGYYVSLGGVKVFASPSTLTGSIGVVSILMNYKVLSDKLGINFETIKKNKYDDIFSSSRKATDEEIEMMKISMKDIYSEFTGHVIKERKISPDVIPAIAEGRIWTGEQALKNKLVDSLGGLSDVLNFASKTNKLGNYSIESFPRPAGFFDKLLNQEEVSFNNKIISEMFGYEDSKNIKQAVNLYKYSLENNKKPSTILPFVVE